MKRSVTALIGFWLALLIISPGFCVPAVEQDFGLATGTPAAPAVKAPAPVKKVAKKPAPHKAAKKAPKARPLVHKPVVAKAVAKKMQTPAPKPMPKPAPKLAPVTAAVVQKPATPVVSTAQPTVRVPVTPAPSAPANSLPTASPKPREDKIALLLKEADEQKPAARPTGDWAKTGFRTILSLAFVLALAYVTILALKRLSDKRESRPQGTKNLEIMDTIKLGTNSSIHLVNVRGKTLLLGSTAGQVSVLTEIESDASDASAEDPQADKRFAEYLEKYYDGSKQSGPATRMAGLLRDTAQHLRGRRPKVAAGLETGGTDES